MACLCLLLFFALFERESWPPCRMPPPGSFSSLTYDDLVSILSFGSPPCPTHSIFVVFWTMVPLDISEL